MKALGISLLVSATLAASLLLFSAADAGTGFKDPAPARLLSFKRVKHELVFEVISTGCTSENDFELHTTESKQVTAENVENTSINIELIRKSPDLCRRMPKAVVITKTVSDNWLAETSIIVNNPFIQFATIKRN